MLYVEALSWPGQLSHISHDEKRGDSVFHLYLADGLHSQFEESDQPPGALYDIDHHKYIEYLAHDL